MKLPEHQQQRIQQRIDLGNGHTLARVDPPSLKELQATGATAWQPDDLLMNIYRLGNDGEIVWQVRSFYPELPDSERRDDPFETMWLDASDPQSPTLKANRWTGDNYAIDLTSGEATKIGWSK